MGPEPGTLPYQERKSTYTACAMLSTLYGIHVLVTCLMRVPFFAFSLYVKGSQAHPQLSVLQTPKQGDWDPSTATGEGYV